MKNVKKTRQKNASKTKPKRQARSATAASRKRNTTRASTAKTSAAEPISTANSYVTIAEQDLILLQTTDQLGMPGLEDRIFQAFTMSERSRRAGTQWLAFGRSDMPHHMGKSSWIGLSRSIPLPIIDAIQTSIEAAGLEVERDMGRAFHLKMNPFARLSDDGLEILVPAALVGDPTKKRIVERGGSKPTARGYHLEPDRAASLQQLFFGSDDPAG